jgi:outer membrane protein assembly factor BamB
VSATHLKWKSRKGIVSMSSPLIVGDHVFKLARKLHCWERATGTVLWSEDLSGEFSSSPVATADGRIYFASAGPSWVVKAGATFELLGTSDLGEPSTASPAVSDGCLFLKGSKTLFCVGSM